VNTLSFSVCSKPSKAVEIAVRGVSEGIDCNEKHVNVRGQSKKSTVLLETNRPRDVILRLNSSERNSTPCCELVAPREGDRETSKPEPSWIKIVEKPGKTLKGKALRKALCAGIAGVCY